MSFRPKRQLIGLGVKRDNTQNYYACHHVVFSLKELKKVAKKGDMIIVDRIRTLLHFEENSFIQLVDEKDLDVMCFELFGFDSDEQKRLAYELLSTGY